MKTISFFENKNIISARLRIARERAKLTQELLAKRLQLLGVGIDQQAISKIERNARIVTDYELKCLCKILKVEEKWLLAEFSID